MLPRRPKLPRRRMPPVSKRPALALRDLDDPFNHARLVIGAHRRSGVTLSGEPNPDYIR